MLAWMAWTWQTAIFFGFIALALVILDAACNLSPAAAAQWHSRLPDHSEAIGSLCL